MPGERLGMLRRVLRVVSLSPQATDSVVDIISDLLTDKGKAQRALATLGRKLANLRLSCKAEPESLKRRENPAVPPSLRVEKLGLGKNKASSRDASRQQGVAPVAGSRLTPNP